MAKEIVAVIGGIFKVQESDHCSSSMDAKMGNKRSLSLTTTKYALNRDGQSVLRRMAHIDSGKQGDICIKSIRGRVASARTEEKFRVNTRQTQRRGEVARSLSRYAEKGNRLRLTVI